MSAVVFPLVFGTLVGYHRDQGNAEQEQIFYQLHYNICATLLLLLSVATVVTTHRFRKSMDLASENTKAVIKNPIRKV